MKPVRIYTSFLKDGDWNHRVFRNTKMLREKWNEEFASGPWELCIIHRGYDRPAYDAEQVANLLTIQKKPVLFTESAKRGLPAPHSICSEAPVGSCTISGREQPCNLYFALDGWGYQLSEKKLPTFNPAAKNAADPEGWVKDLAEEAPNITASLAKAGIYNESSYLQNKHRLTEDTRTAAGNFRFLSYKRDDECNPFAILSICPDWLLDCTLNRINLTVRLKNILALQNIIFVKDIQKYTANELLKIYNFGEGSLRDLAEALLAAFEEYGKNPDLLVDSIEEVSLYDYIQKSLAALPEEERQILTARLGSDGRTPQTLQAIGNIFGMTREWVRQIEKKYLNAIFERELWGDLIYEKINTLQAGRTGPLYLDMLSAEDEWFKGFEGKEGFLKEVITRFSEKKVRVLKLKGRSIVSSIVQYNFKKLVRRIKANASSHLDSAWTKQQTEEMVETECLEHGGHALKETVWNAIANELHFATSITGKEVLVGVGSGAHNFVSIVLTEAKKPLHYLEIHKRVNAISRSEIGIQRVRSCLTEIPEAKLFDQGIYGLRHHLDIDEEIAKKLISQVEEIISNGPKHKQWHISDLIRILFDKDSELANVLNQYDIEILLGDSKNLIYLGKHFWALKHRGKLSKSDKIHINSALISVLKDAGHPLKTSEMIDRASQYRSIKANAQIYSTKVLVRISPDTWGLAHRDLPFNDEEKECYLKVLMTHLQHEQKVIHISEVPAVLKQYKADCSFDGNAFVFLSFCGTDERFRIWHGHLIGLAGWSLSVHHTIVSAFRKVLPTITTPTAMSVVQQRMESILKHPVSKNKVSRLLSSSPAIYDVNLGKWVNPERNPESEDEVEVNE